MLTHKLLLPPCLSPFRPRRRTPPLNPSATRIVFETGHIYRTAGSTGDILAQALGPMMDAADAASIAYDPSALPPIAPASVNGTNTTAGPSAADISPVDADADAGIPLEPVVEESGLLGALGRKLKGILGNGELRHAAYCIERVQGLPDNEAHQVLGCINRASNPGSVYLKCIFPVCCSYGKLLQQVLLQVYTADLIPTCCVPLVPCRWPYKGHNSHFISMVSWATLLT